jgi:hypothetical protein
VAERIHAYLVSIAILAAMLVPLSWDPLRGDSFPLSPYPMFSRPKPDARVTVTYVVGITGGDGRRRLSPQLVIGNREVLQARVSIARARNAGAAALRDLCLTVAGRIAARPEMAEVTEVAIVTGTHDAVAYLTGRDRVGTENIHDRCAVVRAR